MQNRSREDILATVIQKMSNLKKTAWKPIVSKSGADSYYASKFGGIPLISNNDWPSCGACGNPMRFFFQLNSEQLPQQAICSFGNGIMQFFYCSSGECDLNPSDYPPSLPFSPRQLVRVMPADRQHILDGIPKMADPFRHQEYFNDYFFSPSLIIGWEQIDDYANFVERFSIEFYLNDYDDDFDIDEDEEYNLAHELCCRENKLCGWPDWSNHREVPACPICAEEMNFIFQSETYDWYPYSWGDCDCGFIFQCQHHLEQMTFTWGS
jgi:uncharacterized protein YwqG